MNDMRNRGGMDGSRSWVRRALRRLRHSPLLPSLAALAWLLLRSGSRPSRLAYPCQRAAAAQASFLLGAFLLPLPAARLALGGAVLAAALAFLFAAGPPARSQDAGGPAPEPRAVELALQERRAVEEPASDVFAVTGTDGRDGGFQRLIERMEERGSSFYDTAGRAGIVGRNDVVIVKVNSQWDQRGGTNTDLLRSILEAVARHPEGFTGEVIVADNGQAQAGSAGRGGSLDWKRSNAADPGQSVRAVVRSLAGTLRVSAVEWDAMTGTRVGEYAEGDAEDGYVLFTHPGTGFPVTYPKFRTSWGTPVSFRLGVWDPAAGRYDSGRLKVLNVPVLKSHSIYGVTGAVKHYMGVVSDRLSGHRAHRGVGEGMMGVQMAETRVPALNILDAVWINARPLAGPATPYAQAARTEVIAASVDPVALDAWAVREILVPAAGALGFPHPPSMDPDSRGRGTFGRWLELSRAALEAGGHPFTSRRERTNVFLARAGAR